MSLALRCAGVVAIVTASFACDAPQRPTFSAPPPDAAAAPGSPPAGRPLGYVNGKTLRIHTLGPELLEAAGGQVLAEHVLQIQLDTRLERSGLTVTEDDIVAERELMLAGLAPDENQAARLLGELRRVRGLGERRYNGLLWRNAALRKLVADDFEVTDAALEQEREILYGPQFNTRLIVAPNAQVAGEVLAQLAGGASFAQLAAERSTDPSAGRGGLMPPMSPVDPTFSEAIREAVIDLVPGQVSPPIAIEGGYALLLLESITPAQQVEWDEVEPRLRSRIRLRGQSVLMQQVARGILQEARVTVLDPGLGESWRQYRLRLEAPDP